MNKGVIVVVAGGKRFKDVKLLHRALDAFHRKHHIGTLITGELPGAEEMAYFWGVTHHIATIITKPTTPDLIGRYSIERRNCDVLKEYSPFAVIAFPGEGQTEHMIAVAEEINCRVWKVAADWR